MLHILGAGGDPVSNQSHPARTGWSGGARRHPAQCAGVDDLDRPTAEMHPARVGEALEHTRDDLAHAAHGIGELLVRQLDDATMAEQRSTAVRALAKKYDVKVDGPRR